jgi:MYXO-CTERM domain-containing protein
MNSKDPSKRPASLQPLPLAAYLTGAVGSTFLVSAPQAEAAVTAVTFGFGSVLDTTDGGNFGQTTPNFGYLLGSAYPYAVMLGNVSNYGKVYHNGAYRGNMGTASFFESGTVIGNGNNGPSGRSYFSNSFVSSANIPTDQLNKNIGFQTSAGNFGWANVSWDATAKAVTFNSAYVESVAGTTITVGDTGVSAVPEPSRALLALAGFGAVALRRRRK